MLRHLPTFSHKIDVVVASAMAALGAVCKGQIRNGVMEYIARQLARMAREGGKPGLGLCANPTCFRRPNRWPRQPRPSSAT